LDTVERLFFGNAARVLGSIVPIIFSALGLNALAGKLLNGLTTADERQIILRGLPYNPTTEMNLALWALAQQAHADSAAAQALRETSPEQLAQDYRNQMLPPTLQHGLADFLGMYGHRGVAEIDLGLPRWSEDPAHILGVLANYLQLKNPEQAPDVQSIKASPPMDVLWFRLPRKLDDPHGALIRIGHGHAFIKLDRGEQWQIASIIPKGSYQQLRAAGLKELRHSIAETAPEFSDRVAGLTDWKQFSLLSIEADRLPRWYRPGLLLIGDAAHVMSSAGGNGINYAIQDAVAAANLLSAPLLAGRVSVEDLARVQSRREWPVRFIQALVNVLQDCLIAAALNPQTSFTVPGFVHWRPVGNIAARLSPSASGRNMSSRRTIRQYLGSSR
jgi:FAD binding domain